MKIAINDKIYDSNEVPVLIEFTAQERLDIIGMPPDNNILILAPDNLNTEGISKWGQHVINQLHQGHKKSTIPQG